MSARGEMPTEVSALFETTPASVGSSSLGSPSSPLLSCASFRGLLGFLVAGALAGFLVSQYVAIFVLFCLPEKVATYGKSIGCEGAIGGCSPWVSNFTMCTTAEQAQIQDYINNEKNLYGQILGYGAVAGAVVVLLILIGCEVAILCGRDSAMSSYASVATEGDEGERGSLVTAGFRGGATATPVRGLLSAGSTPSALVSNDP